MCRDGCGQKPRSPLARSSAAFSAFAPPYGAKIKELEKQNAKLLDRLVETDNASIIKAYEKRIADLDEERLILNKKAARVGQPRAPFEQMFELAMQFPASLCKFWETGRFELQRLVLKLTFFGEVAL